MFSILAKLDFKMKNKKNIYISFLLGLLTVFFNSCQDEPSDSPYVKNSQTTVLVYVVATNNLSVNLDEDKDEMLLGAERINISKNNILVYQTTYNNNPQLLRIVKTDDGYAFEEVKEYSKEVASLDPSRITEVINYVLDSYPAKNYGLIFWSHSSGSQPFLDALEADYLPSQRSFGQDLSTDNAALKSINIDRLASLIPPGVFEYIWFDSCYMSNIESIYEFRGKCKYYVGYATEVCDTGMPYNLVLPHITGTKLNLVKAGEEFFKYYNEHPYSLYRVGTVAVIDMEKIEELSNVSKTAYKNVGASVNTNSFMCYTRGSTGPFYELGDYVKSMVDESDYDVFVKNWEDALSKCVVYKGATDRDFNGRNIDKERYTGLSCHIYHPEDNSVKEKYYKSLSWYVDVCGE